MASALLIEERERGKADRLVRGEVHEVSLRECGHVLVGEDPGAILLAQFTVSA